MRKTKPENLLIRIEKMIVKLTKDRDKLRDLYYELLDILDSMDGCDVLVEEGLRNITDGIHTASKYV